MKYTREELDAHSIADFLNDADCAERQASEGPFHPEKNITAETLLKYAKECREVVLKYKNGGLHDYLMKSN